MIYKTLKLKCPFVDVLFVSFLVATC